ncbi:MAG: DUF1887 family CARF protein [Ignavibacteria bacterium]
MKVLYHIVSGQTLPNYISAEIIKPDKNIYLYTNESTKHLQYLKSVIKGDSEEYKVDAWEDEATRGQVRNILRQHDKDESILDFTCGTKILSFACYEVFKQMNKDCVYINTEKNEVLSYCFSKSPGQTSKDKIDIKAELSDIIKLNGQTLKHSALDEPPEFQRTALFLEKNFKHYSSLIFRFARKNSNDILSDISDFKGNFIKYENGRSEICFMNNGNVA